MRVSGVEALSRSHREDLVAVPRLRRVGRAALVLSVGCGIGALALALASVGDPVGLRVATGALLAALVIVTLVMCAHAGGHAWVVPLPALALAVAWGLTASGPSQSSGWWLVATAAAATAAAVAVAGAALRLRLGGSLANLPALAGSTGVAVTALDPTGVVQVAGEAWTAASLSGPLPAGAPVHVVRAVGVRLDVWSEVGTPPGLETLEMEDRS